MIATTPVPVELPLPLPMLRPMLEAFMVGLFLLHILFVNLTVGGSLLTVFYELRGRREKDYDRLAQAIAATVTVNKSLAVVLGVGPLLVMNALYALHFYAANALTGNAWIMIVPLTTIAFLLTYAHKYTWTRLGERKGLHLAIGASAAGVFLVIPLIFLSNVNLMLFPERWPDLGGFLTALALPNVLPRYAHFFLACLAVTGLFLAWRFSKTERVEELGLERLDAVGLRQHFLALAFGATGLQLIAGPLVFFTLPSGGFSWSLVLAFFLGVTLACIALALLWRQLLRRREGLGRFCYGAVVLIALAGLLMGTGRHLFRENTLAPHREQIAERSAAFRTASLAAAMRKEAGIVREDAAPLPAGEKLFRAVCAACHAPDTRLVGPPITEMVEVYADDPVGLIAWVRAPGKKRAGYPAMPAIKLTDAQYDAVASYLLEPVAKE